MTEKQTEDIVRGKDFVQLKNGPFDIDLVFAPDGIEHFEDAWRRRVDVDGFPVCHPDDIIASKIAAIEARCHVCRHSEIIGYGQLVRIGSNDRNLSQPNV